MRTCRAVVPLVALTGWTQTVGVETGRLSVRVAEAGREGLVPCRAWVEVLAQGFSSGMGEIVRVRCSGAAYTSFV